MTFFVLLLCSLNFGLTPNWFQLRADLNTSYFSTQVCVEGWIEDFVVVFFISFFLSFSRVKYMDLFKKCTFGGLVCISVTEPRLKEVGCGALAQLLKLEKIVNLSGTIFSSGLTHI